MKEKLLFISFSSLLLPLTACTGNPIYYSINKNKFNEFVNKAKEVAPTVY